MSHDGDDKGFDEYDDDGDGDDGESLGRAIPRRQTEKALLVYCEDLAKELWIPKSVIHDDSEVFGFPQEPGELIVKSWWADKNGL